jgi:hypothetical protein
MIVISEAIVCKSVIVIAIIDTNAKAIIVVVVIDCLDITAMLRALCLPIGIDRCNHTVSSTDQSPLLTWHMVGQ